MVGGWWEGGGRASSQAVFTDFLLAYLHAGLAGTLLTRSEVRKSFLSLGVPQTLPSESTEHVQTVLLGREGRMRCGYNLIYYAYV